MQIKIIEKINLETEVLFATLLTRFEAKLFNATQLLNMT